MGQSVWSWNGIFLLGALAVSLSQAQEAPPFKSKDWIVEKKLLPLIGNDLCVASTQKKVENITWTFSLHFDPTQKVPSTLLISNDGTDSFEKLTLRSDSSKTLFGFLRSPGFDSGAASYWYAPVQFSQLYKQIRRDSSLKVSYLLGDKIKNFYFSLSGSMNAFNHVSKSCFEGRDFLSADFFDYLDKIKVTTPGEGSPVEVKVLAEHVQSAWSAYRQSGAESQALKVVDAKLKPLVEEEKKFLERSGLLTQEIKTKSELKKSLELQNTTLKDKKLALEQDLKQTETQLEPALADLRQKYDVYAPLAEQAKSYFQDVSDSESQLRQDQGDVGSLRTELNEVRNEISHHTANYQKCSQRAANSNHENLRRQLEVARNEYRENSYEARIAWALSNDSELSNLESSEARLTREINFAESSANHQEQLVYHLRTQLNHCYSSCQNSTFNNLKTIEAFKDRGHSGPGGHCKQGDVYCGGECHSSASRCPGNSRPKPEEPSRPRPNPNPPHNPNPPTFPPEDPRPPRLRPDCDSVCGGVKMQLYQAERELEQLKDRVRSLQSDLTQVSHRKDRRRAEIGVSVRQTSDHYEDRVRNSENQYEQARRDYEANVQCQNQSTALLRSAQSRLPGLERSLANSENQAQRSSEQLGRAVERLRTFRQNSGYERAREAYSSADSSAKAIQSRLATLDSSIRSTADTIARNSQKISQLQMQIETLIASVAQNTEGLSLLEAALAPLREAKQQWVAALAETQALLLSKATSFKEGLESLKTKFAIEPKDLGKGTKFYHWEL